jgi:beta-fructofuranosidase
MGIVTTERGGAFFLPDEGWVGDVIPVADGGTARLYFLHEERLDPDQGMPWRLVTTTDFVHFTDEGIALPSGGREAADFHCYTGSVVPDDGAGVAHLFYTGHNPDVLSPDGTTPLQVVMHATSTDGMRSWQKRPEDTFGAPGGYEPGDWRDPFVFRDSPDAPWRMLLAGRRTEGPLRRRGVLVQLQSDDLVTWRLAEPFWDPRRFITQECPDVFEWNGRWYLVYSEFSDVFATRYRYSDSPDGPWRAPAFDTVDGRAFYAAKTLRLNGRRYFVGWIATKQDDRDDGAYEWAGTMAVLEATQRPDGSLDFRMPESLLESFDEPVQLDIDARLRLDAAESYEVAITSEAMPSACRLRVELRMEAGTKECGLLLRSSSDGDEGYVLRLEPQRDRMVLDRWPRLRTGGGQWQISGDVPFAIETERPVPLPPGAHSIDVVMDGSVLVAVVDDRVALSARIYDRAIGRIGVFAADGVVTFDRVEAYARGTRGSNAAVRWSQA